MITNSLLIATIILLIILTVPILCEKIHLPSIVGLIIAGVLVGPQVLGWINRDSTIETLGNLGLLYLMFMSGIEISLSDLQREKYKSMLFGLLTFTLPALLGFAAGNFVFHYSMPATILLGAMLGGHTLITYPVVSRYNIQRNRAVSLIIGGTIVAVTASMVFLAVIASMSRGNIDAVFWVRMSVGSVVMLIALFYGMPRLAEQVFKHFNDSIIEYTFVILMAAGSGVLAWLAGLEPVLGVFLAGLALNRQIPNLSPLMNRINFVGNALFIPVFLIGVGLLIDLRVFTQGWNAMLVAVLMIVATMGGKWLAALLVQKTFRLTRYQRQLTFGLSNAKAAGSLAAVTIAYNLHIFDDSVLNGTVIMILITCAVSSFLTEHAAKHIAQEETEAGTDDPLHPARILLPVANPENSGRLVELATFVTDRSSVLHAMAVIRQPEERRRVERMLEQVARMSAAADYRMTLHTQMAENVSNGILNIANAEQITHIFAGIADDEEHTYGKALNPLLTTAPQGLWIYHTLQPLKTITNVRILAPEHAEKETGYNEWRSMVARIIQQTHADVTQEVMTSWAILPRIAETMAEDDLLIVVQARPSTVSFHPDMQHTAEVLKTRFKERNYLVIFPQLNLDAQADNPFFSEFTRHNESSFALFERLHRRVTGD